MADPESEENGMSAAQELREFLEQHQQPHEQPQEPAEDDPQSKGVNPLSRVWGKLRGR